MKSSEEKALKNKQKKLDKQLKKNANAKLNPEEPKPFSLLLEYNDNEPDISENNENSKNYEAKVPTSNKFECFAEHETKPSNEIRRFAEMDTLEDFEQKIRAKVSLVIKRKLNSKLEGNGIDVDHLKILEDELTEDMEEVVQAELETYRNTLENVIEDEQSNPDPYAPPEGCSGFYWGGQDFNEIVFYD